MKKHLVFAAVPFLALGCGKELEDANGDGIADGVREPDNVTVVTPATPKGTVSGQVLGTDLRALDAVDVEMTIGSSAEPVKATTDAKGNFEFSEVPAGAQVLLTFSKANYATLRASSTVPSSAGNVPINDGNASFGPITLARLDGTLNFLVVTPQGRPASGVRATLEATPAGNIVLFNSENTTEVVSTVVVEATSNDQGLLAFTGIPSAVELARLTSNSVSEGEYRLWVSPMDSDGNGFPETGGFTATYRGSTVVTNAATRLISLPYARISGSALSIAATNVNSLRPSIDSQRTFEPLRNMVRPGDPIHLFFNQPVQQNSLLARMTDEYARELLPVTVSLSNGGYSATITPNGATVDGREYNVNVRAVAVEGGDVLSLNGFFFAGDYNVSTAKTVTAVEARYQETTNTAPTNSQINFGETVYVNFNYPISKTFTSSDAVYVHLNADIGGATIGVIGDHPGEVGHPVGYALTPAEPTAPIQTRNPAETPVFQIITSGYTTRWAFTFTGDREIQSFSNLSMVVAFSKLPSRYINGTYENAWGQPVTSDLAVTGVIQQPMVSP